MVCAEGRGGVTLPASGPIDLVIGAPGDMARNIRLGKIAVIALQAWMGRLCPLTTWEQALRNRAGQDTYGESFIQHWLSRLIFFDAPWWAFVFAYTAFAGLVAWCWWRWPPRARRRS